MLISTDFIKQFNDRKKGFKFKIYKADILGETSRHKCKDFFINIPVYNWKVFIYTSWPRFR